MLLLRLTGVVIVKRFSGRSVRIVEELNYADNQTYQWYSGYQTLNIAPLQVFSAAEYPNSSGSGCCIDFCVLRSYKIVVKKPLLILCSVS